MNYDINDILCVLSESTVDGLFNQYDYKLITEGETIEKIKETTDKVKNSNAVKKGKEIGKKVLDSPVGKVAGGVYNTATEFPGEIVGKVAYGRKLSKNNSPEVQKEYHKKMINVKSNIKTGITVGILLSKNVLIGPPDWIITACMTAGLAKDTEVNQETKRKVANLTNKAKDIVSKIKNLATKHKNTDSTDKEFNKEYNDLLRQGNELAKEADKELRGTQNKLQIASESTIIDILDDHLINENGLLLDNTEDVLFILVEKTDYTKIDLYPIIEHYCDMMYKKEV